MLSFQLFNMLSFQLFNMLSIQLLTMLSFKKQTQIVKLPGFNIKKQDFVTKHHYLPSNDSSKTPSNLWII